jgi:hypothetical protein
MSPVDFSNQAEQGWFENQMSEVVLSKHHSEYEICICRDGRIMLRIDSLENQRQLPPEFDLKKSIEIWSDYLMYLNALYLFLDCATIQVDNIAIFNLGEITHRDAFRVSYADGRFEGEGISSESIVSKFQMARYLSGYPQGLPIHLNPDLRNRLIVSQGAIDCVIANFESVYSQKELVRAISVVSKSLGEYKIGGYQTSIVLAWFEIEKILNTQWYLHLESINSTNADGIKRINSDRFDTLLGKNGFNSSQITNLLELKGILTFGEYADINKSRVFRNKIAHGKKFLPSADDARHVLQVASKLLEKFYSIELSLNFGYSIAGI